MSKLLRYLPPYEQTSIVFQEIMRAFEKEFEQVGLDIKDFEAQLNPDTATWGLRIFEAELGLPVEPDLDIDMRRRLVKSRLLMRPPGSKSKLVEILKTFVETAEIEEHFGGYRFDVVLKTKTALGDKVSHIRNTLEVFKPAHLDYIFVICYLTKVLLGGSFKKWLSESLDVCGTRDVNENPYTATDGWVYRAGMSYRFKEWPSWAFLRASPETFTKARGRSYVENVRLAGNSYKSEKFLVCSETTYVKEAAV